MESVIVGITVANQVARTNRIKKFKRLSLDTGTFLAHNGVVDEIVADEQGRFHLEEIEKNRALRMIHWIETGKNQ